MQRRRRSPPPRRLRRHLLRLSRARLSPDKSHRRNRSVSVVERRLRPRVCLWAGATPNDITRMHGRKTNGRTINLYIFTIRTRTNFHYRAADQSNGIRPSAWRPRGPSERYWPARASPWSVSRLPGRALGGSGSGGRCSLGRRRPAQRQRGAERRNPVRTGAARAPPRIGRTN